MCYLISFFGFKPFKILIKYKFKVYNIYFKNNVN